MLSDFHRSEKNRGITESGSYKDSNDTSQMNTSIFTTNICNEETNKHTSTMLSSTSSTEDEFLFIKGNESTCCAKNSKYSNTSKCVYPRILKRLESIETTISKALCNRDDTVAADNITSLSTRSRHPDKQLSTETD